MPEVVDREKQHHHRKGNRDDDGAGKKQTNSNKVIIFQFKSNYLLRFFHVNLPSRDGSFLHGVQSVVVREGACIATM
jgi:hypothetical protein